MAKAVTEGSVLAVVLAAGDGTRMLSQRPKILHEIAGRSMLAHVLAAAAAAGAAEVAVVVNPGRDDVRREVARVAPSATLFMQAERLGTAHAVLAARPALEAGQDVLVAFGDTPLVEAATLEELRRRLSKETAVAVLGFEAADPTGYGRLLLDASGDLAAIREERDASEDERKILLCNAGLMALSGSHALALLEAVGNANAKREFYLTDVVALARGRGLGVAVVRAPESDVLGVNDRQQLAVAEGLMQERLRRKAMAGGVTLRDPASVYLAADTAIEPDVVIEPHVVIGPGVTIGRGTTIHAFSHIAGATIGANVSVGPFARLRPGANLAAASRVGNFVEIKEASIGEGAKVNHLSYIGDATVGAEANVGAGTITCNYDGFAKHRTEIGAGAFIGSNSALVAPVRIGEGAYVGSGSVITDPVAPDDLAIGRGRQVSKPGWAKLFRASHEKHEKKY
jgi:bifunctional UDP-N-acetylglucosamine pyrophosphorylase/glucosamine-1-phosphate N-acetyltransferase